MTRLATRPISASETLTADQLFALETPQTKEETMTPTERKTRTARAVAIGAARAEQRAEWPARPASQVRPAAVSPASAPRTAPQPDAELTKARKTYAAIRSRFEHHGLPAERFDAQCRETLSAKSGKPTPQDWVYAASLVTVTCERCGGSGIYAWGTITNGVPAHSGQCFRCGGKGYQNDADLRRNFGYDTNVLGAQAAAELGLESDDEPMASSSGLEEIEITLEPTPPAPQPDGHPTHPGILDATYTVERKDGSYRTIRVRTQREDASFAPGKTVIAYLSGSDNEGSYTGCAFYDRETGRISMYKRVAGGPLEADIRFCMAVIAGDQDAAREAFAHKSGKCAICGRKLTVPASIHRGMGPDCYARVMGGIA